MSENVQVVKSLRGRNHWCVHYAGFAKPNRGLEKVTHCKAGVEYASVAKPASWRHDDDSPHTAFKEAHPCFQDQAALTDGCAKCRYPSPEEIAKRDAEISQMLSGVATARSAIIADLKRRHEAGDSTVKMNKSVDAECFDGHGPTNYVSGTGKIDCPVCKTGKLGYSRAGYNGHVHAGCTTENCVRWME